jgi:hypothetical protein
MRLGLLVLMVVAPAAWSGPASADDNVLCVQQRLAARGLNPGPLDGELGARTRTAAQSAAAAQRLALPTLTIATAGAWCQALGSSPVVTFSLPAASATSGVFADPQRPRGCPRYVIDPEDECY